MNNEIVTVEGMIAHLNSLVVDVTGRIGDDRPVHSEVIDRCEAYLNSLGLRASTWGASLIWDKDSDIMVSSQILSYDFPGFVKDRRHKYGLIGKLTTPPVWSAEYTNGIRDDKNPIVVIPEPCWTVRRYVLEIHRAEKSASLASAEAWVENLQNQLTEAHKKVQVAGAELDLVNETIVREFTNYDQ